MEFLDLMFSVTSQPDNVFGTRTDIACPEFFLLLPSMQKNCLLLPKYYLKLYFLIVLENGRARRYRK